MDKSDVVSASSGDEAEETDHPEGLKMGHMGDSEIATTGPFLLDLSDDVLLIILSFLSQIDLIMLGHTCSRLETLTVDRTLWLNVDCRGRSLAESTFRRALSSLLPTTRSLALDLGRVTTVAADKEEDSSLAELAVSQARHCLDLRALTLENARIDACRLQITGFPSHLTYWSLKGSTVEDLPFERSYFMDLHRHMPNLQVLVLSECPWFQAHSLMAIAKCPLLRELRLDGCVHLGNCMAYCSMSARFAFKSLQTLDVRRTRLSDSEIGCFNRVTTLRHLLVESHADSDRVELAEEVPDDSVTCRVLPSRCMIVLDRVNNEYIVNRQVVLRPDIHEDEINHIIRNVDSMDRFIDQGRACVEGAAPNHVEIHYSNRRNIYIDIDMSGRRAVARQGSHDDQDAAGPSREPQPLGEGPQNSPKMQKQESDSEDDAPPPVPAEPAHEENEDAGPRMAHYSINDGPYRPTGFTGPNFVVWSSPPRGSSPPCYIPQAPEASSHNIDAVRALSPNTNTVKASSSSANFVGMNEALEKPNGKPCPEDAGASMDEAVSPLRPLRGAVKRKTEDSAGPSGLSKVQRRSLDAVQGGAKEDKNQLAEQCMESAVKSQGLVAFLPEITLTNWADGTQRPADNDVKQDHNGDPMKSDVQISKHVHAEAETSNKLHHLEDACSDDEEKQFVSASNNEDGKHDASIEDNEMDDSSGESDSDSDETQAATSNFVGGRLLCCHYRSRRRPRRRRGLDSNVDRAVADDNAVNIAVGPTQSNGRHGDWRRILRERAKCGENGDGADQGQPSGAENQNAESQRLGLRVAGTSRAAAKKALSRLGERWDVQSSSDEDVAEQARLEMLVRCAKKSRLSGDPVSGGPAADAGPSGGGPDGPVKVLPGQCNGEGPSTAGPSTASRDDGPQANVRGDGRCHRDPRRPRPASSCVRFLVPPASRLVTDVAVQNLFAGDADWPYMVRIALEPVPRSRLETLVLRGFPGVTDLTLRVLASVPTLRTLDVTGTGVTADGVATFRALRPEVRLLASFE